MTIHRSVLSFNLLILLGFVWGTGYAIARYAVTHGVPPLGYTFCQSVGPALLLAVLVGFKRPSRPEMLTLSHLRYYLISGLTGIAIPNTIMYFAAAHLNAGLLAVVVNTVPIFAYPIALLARVERFNFIRISGVLLAVAGLMLIVLPKASLPSHEMMPWVLIALLTPFSFACCAVFIARYRPPSSHSLTLAAGTLLFSSILLIPLTTITKSFYSLHWPLLLPDQVILLEILLSTIGYILFFQLIKMAGPVYYSFVDTIVALTGLFWGRIIFHEALNGLTTYAVVLILISLIVVNQKPAWEKSVC